mmetsp:Transcript_6864/g.25641  ORF Transcript_6864/g.25641 Transcript_6864/m.25641 type:complete len:314 (+) Transcript_6864:1904-2845(+)
MPQFALRPIRKHQKHAAAICMRIQDTFFVRNVLLDSTPTTLANTAKNVRLVGFVRMVLTLIYAKMASCRCLGHHRVIKSATQDMHAPMESKLHAKANGILLLSVLRHVSSVFQVHTLVLKLTRLPRHAHLVWKDFTVLMTCRRRFALQGHGPQEMHPRNKNTLLAQKRLFVSKEKKKFAKVQTMHTCMSDAEPVRKDITHPMPELTVSHATRIIFVQTESTCCHVHMDTLRMQEHLHVIWNVHLVHHAPTGCEHFAQTTLFQLEKRAIVPSVLLGTTQWASRIQGMCNAFHALQAIDVMVFINYSATGHHLTT